MKLCIFAVVLAHFCFADVPHDTNHGPENNGEFYEYDTTRNGWYIGSRTDPIMVTLRRHRYHDIPDRYYDFANRTFIRQPTGVCSKEIPTTSLLEPGQSIPRGNGSNPTLSRITVCCQGYQRDPHIVRKCNPICHTECVNGICYSPNECICFPEHVKNLAGYCVPTCPIGCDNGDCKENTCICKPGFALDKTGKFCAPVCDPPCGKGNCTAPNTCSCNRGYDLKENGVCVPKCTDGCDYGECVAPEKCACRPGYILQHSVCSPVCEKGCINGVCTAPNQCSCRDRLTIDKTGTKCDPKCDPACINGVCNRNNECECNPGYRSNRNEPHRCNPHCPEPCVNGVCSAPGLCLCNLGFVKDRSVKGSQICIPRE